MTREEAKEYAKTMTYRDAVYNALQGKCIPYRKATLIKLYELLDMVEPQESSDDYEIIVPKGIWNAKHKAERDET